MAKDNRAEFLNPLQLATLTLCGRQTSRNVPKPTITTRHFLGALSTLTSRLADMHQNRSVPPQISKPSAPSDRVHRVLPDH